MHSSTWIHFFSFYWLLSHTVYYNPFVCEIPCSSKYLPQHNITIRSTINSAGKYQLDTDQTDKPASTSNPVAEVARGMSPTIDLMHGISSGIVQQENKTVETTDNSITTQEIHEPGKRETSPPRPSHSFLYKSSTGSKLQEIIGWERNEWMIKATSWNKLLTRSKSRWKCNTIL